MRQNLLSTLARFDKALTVGLEAICIVLFAGITVILTLNIVVRFVPIMSMHWFDEIVELLYGALVFYGAAAVWVVHGHFSVGDWISKRLPNMRARYSRSPIISSVSPGYSGGTNTAITDPRVGSKRTGCLRISTKVSCTMSSAV